MLQACLISGLLGLFLLAQASNTNSTLLKMPFTSSVSTSTSESGNIGASTRNAVLKVVASVSAGSGQTWDNVLIDTGSAILWVGGNGTESYIPGSSSKNLDTAFSVGYGTGFASGEAYTDRVTIGDAVATSQIIGAANYTDGFTTVEPIDGILGLSPANSNAGQIHGYNSTPTFVQSLQAEGIIENAIFGLYVAPLNTEDEPVGSGEITFGGIDQSRINGTLSWIPQDQPYPDRWTFNITSISFGDLVTNYTIESLTDSGNLYLGIPTQQWLAIMQSIPGANTDENLYSMLVGAIILPGNTSTAALPDLVFEIGEVQVSIPSSSYILPLNMYSVMNVTDDGWIHTWLLPDSWTGALLGQQFLQHAYTAYDMDNNRVGFAPLA